MPLNRRIMPARPWHDIGLVGDIGLIGRCDREAKRRPEAGGEDEKPDERPHQRPKKRARCET